MTNAHYSRVEQYRDVESLNYYMILLGQGKTKEEALAILAARSRDNSRVEHHQLFPFPLPPVSQHIGIVLREKSNRAL